MTDALESVAFTIDVLAKPWERATRDRRTGHYVTRRQTRSFEALVRDTAALHIGSAWRLDGMYEMHMVFDLPTYQTRDWDNLGKAISDALNGVAYHDDNQVMHASVTKRIGKIEPRVSVRLRRIGDWPVKPRRRPCST